MSKFRFPTAFTILFGLIILVAIATWFVPAGKYDRVINLFSTKKFPCPAPTTW